MQRSAYLILIVAIFFTASGGARAEHKSSFMLGDYFRLDESYKAYEDLAAKHPGLVTIEQVGKSVEGNPIVALKIALRDGRERPEALITGNIHANEFLGGRMAYEVARRLADDYGKNPWITSLLDRMDFYVVPMLNPDGFSDACRHAAHGFTARRKNADRVDMNRNFPYPSGVKSKGIMSGSKMKIHPNYKGPYPLSEPETKALAAFAEKHRFFVAINFHTTGGHFIYPYGYGREEPKDLDLYKKMGKSLNDHQSKKKYKVHQAFKWYQTVGNLDDYLYRRYGALSVTVELARYGTRLLNPLRGYNLFWWYNPVNIQEWVNNDRDAALYAIETAFELTGGKPQPPQPTNWRMPDN